MKEKQLNKDIMDGCRNQAIKEEGDRMAGRLRVEGSERETARENKEVIEDGRPVERERGEGRGGKEGTVTVAVLGLCLAAIRGLHAAHHRRSMIGFLI